MSQQDVQSWLVKSGGRILGPFSLTKIKELVRKKELVLTDEVCQPMERWFYIRDKQEFTDLVEEIRRLERVEDPTQTVGVKTDEVTASVTEALDETIDDELTGEVEPIDFEVTQKVDVHFDEEVIERPANERRKPSYDQVKRYGTASSAKQEVQSTKQWGWILTLLIVLGAGAFLSYKKIVVAPKSAEGKFKEYHDFGGFYLRLGQFEEALENFEKAYEIKPTYKGIHLPLGVLQVQTARQTVAGKRLLNKVLDYDVKLKKHALTGIGLANLIEGQYRFAEKNFDLALEMDPNFTSAIINKGIVNFLGRKYKSAQKLFEEAIRTNEREDNSAYVLLANNHIHSWMVSKKKDHLEKAEVLLSDFVRRNYDYRQEAFFLLAYINHLNNNTEKVKAYSERLLNTDPDLTFRFKHDLYIFNDVISWATFLPWCNKMYTVQKDVDYVSALNAFCLVKGGQVRNAESRIIESLNRMPKDPLVNGLNSYILNAAGRYDAASIALGRANEYNKGRKKYYQPMVLQAWFCQENENYDCALENWFKILEVKPSDLQAKVNVAIIRSYNGIRISPKEANLLDNRFGNYIPLRRLKDIYAGYNI